MEKVENKEDKRVKRTRIALFCAYIKLCAALPREKISIRQLCEVAGIGRRTFYMHYPDIAALHTALNAFLTQQARSLCDVLQTDAPTELQKTIAEHLTANKTLYTALCKAPDSFLSVAGILDAVLPPQASLSLRYSMWGIIGICRTVLLEDRIFDIVNEWKEIEKINASSK